MLPACPRSAVGEISAPGQAKILTRRGACGVSAGDRLQRSARRPIAARAARRTMHAGGVPANSRWLSAKRDTTGHNVDRSTRPGGALDIRHASGVQSGSAAGPVVRRFAPNHRLLATTPPALIAVIPSVSRGTWVCGGARMVPSARPGPSTHARDDGRIWVLVVRPAKRARGPLRRTISDRARRPIAESRRTAAFLD